MNDWSSHEGSLLEETMLSMMSLCLPVMGFLSMHYMRLRAMYLSLTHYVEGCSRTHSPGVEQGPRGLCT